MIQDYKADIHRILGELRPIVQEKDAIREKLLQLSRETTRKAGAATNAAVRGSLDKAVKLMEMSSSALREMQALARGHNEFQGWGALDIAEQECIEAKVVIALQQQAPFPDHKEVDVSPLNYLYALADAANEMRRVVLHSLMNDELEKARSRLDVMGDLYEGLLAVGDYSKGVLPQLRKKVDTLRMLVERTEGDVLRAIETKRLEETIRSAQDMYKT